MATIPDATPVHVFSQITGDLFDPGVGKKMTADEARAYTRDLIAAGNCRHIRVLVLDGTGTAYRWNPAHAFLRTERGWHRTILRGHIGQTA